MARFRFWSGRSLRNKPSANYGNSSIPIDYNSYRRFKKSGYRVYKTRR